MSKLVKKHVKLTILVIRKKPPHRKRIKQIMRLNPLLKFKIEKKNLFKKNKKKKNSNQCELTRQIHNIDHKVKITS